MPRAGLLIAALAFSAPALAQEAEPFKGRSLVDAIRTLQARGLPIVFTSATVTPDLRVVIEPRATSARQQLDELLAPHGLQARNGPGGIIQVVRAEGPRRRPAPHDTGPPAVGVSEPAVAGDSPDSVPGHREYVTVTRPAPYQTDRGVAAETRLDRSQWDRLYGSLADDPIRAVHALPRVTPVDEFRSEFAVRGSPFRHVDFVVDGVSTQWLQHTAHDRGASGSVAMLPALAIENATLRAGAYPHRHGDGLGPQLDFTIREGSRTDLALRGAVGGTNATVLGEGPLGVSGRGSWLIALRQSYLEWPVERPESTRTAFEFFDGLAKVVYDARSSQQIAVSVLGGTSSVDGEDNLAPNELGDGTNRALAVNVSWRSALAPAVVLRQRASVVRHGFVNRHQTGRESDRGANEEIVYRADVERPLAGGLLEAGARVGRTAIDDAPRLSDGHAIAGSSWVRSGYAHFAWAATPTLTLSPGVRIATSTRLPHRAVTRWLLGEWAVRPDWVINASMGVSQQLPELRQVLGGAGALDPRPERARHFDVAIEQRLTGSMRWQATAFSRREDDILREPDIHPRLAGGMLMPPERRYSHALAGSSRGIELLLDRRSRGGLSGWAAYSYGETRHTDTDRRETFWGDFDQRHALTLFGHLSLSPRASIGAAFRAGSNFPIPGYLTAHAGGLAVGSDRNRVRLPVYARLDVRADREFEYFGRRLTLFAEMLNVLNRANVGLAGGSIDLATGEAHGFTDALFRRRASAGVLIEF